MQFFCSHAFPDPPRLLQSADCSEEREAGLLGVPVAFCCVSTTLTQAPCRYLVPTPDNHNARYGASDHQPVQTPICSKTVPQQVQLLTTEAAAGMLVPRLLGQPLLLKLVANSPEPRQGFVFAKNVLGTQPAWVCTSLPTPRLHSY